MDIPRPIIALVNRLLDIAGVLAIQCYRFDAADPRHAAAQAAGTALRQSAECWVADMAASLQGAPSAPKGEQYQHISRGIAQALQLTEHLPPAFATEAALLAEAKQRLPIYLDDRPAALEGSGGMNEMNLAFGDLAQVRA